VLTNNRLHIHCNFAMKIGELHILCNAEIIDFCKIVCHRDGIVLNYDQRARENEDLFRTILPTNRRVQQFQ
jgi:hypothetical protein